MNKEELKKYREQIGLTQEQLAMALHIATNTVSRWERGDRSIPPYLYLALETVAKNHSKNNLKQTT